MDTFPLTNNYRFRGNVGMPLTLGSSAFPAKGACHVSRVWRIRFLVLGARFDPLFHWLSAVRLVSFGNLIRQNLDRPLFSVSPALFLVACLRRAGRGCCWFQRDSHASVQHRRPGLGGRSWTICSLTASVGPEVVGSLADASEVDSPPLLGADSSTGIQVKEEVQEAESIGAVLSTIGLPEEVADEPVATEVSEVLERALEAIRAEAGGLVKAGTWDLRSVCEKEDVRKEAKASGISVHFGQLMTIAFHWILWAGWSFAQIGRSHSLSRRLREGRAWGSRCLPRTRRQPHVSSGS